ncbi:MAG: hypothetical protein QM778_35075 [Myxococcales bacterium]
MPYFQMRSPRPVFKLTMLSLLLAGACSADPNPGTVVPDYPGSSRDGGGDGDGDLSDAKETAKQCNDGKDNDDDGLSDCDDSDCEGVKACADNPGKFVSDSGACNTAHGDGVARSAPVDIVWVIDDSFSMLDDIMRVQQNMASFAMSLVKAGLDYHIVVLNAPAAAWDAKTLGLEPARFLAVDAVTFNVCYTPAVGSFSSYSSMLRPDAALHFIMVTDDNDVMSWADFKSQMDTLVKGRKYTVHAIVDPPEHCATSTRPGTVYIDGAKATGGVQKSICEADWSPTFTAIENSIQKTAVIPCEYDIPEPTGGETYDRTKVNVLHSLNGTTTPFMRKASMADCGSDKGWYYDNPDDPKQVLLCPMACTFAESEGGSINLEFVCDETMLF